MQRVLGRFVIAVFRHGVVQYMKPRGPSFDR
jgi:hypothetical protein